MSEIKSQENKEDKLKIIFFGTPEFSVPSLVALNKKFHVIACVTQPDKPKGRYNKMHISAIKEFAQTNNIPILQPHTLRQSKPEGQKFKQQLEELEADLAVVVAYGKIIPPEILAVLPNRFINVHGSILPKLRGASPIQYAILEGHETSGITIMVMDEGMDTGPTLSTKELKLSPTETASSLHDKLKDLGSELLITTILDYLAGKITPAPQDNEQATYSKIIKKEDGQIHWSKSPQEIDRLIRAFTPWPGAFTFLGNNKVRLQVTKASINESGALEIEEIKPSGKQAMSYQAYLNGHPGHNLPPVTR